MTDPEKNPKNFYVSCLKKQNDTFARGIKDPSDSHPISLYFTTVLLRFYKIGTHIFCT